jgi:pyrimidine operon attenuation protein / uracil phosphoribosyltransferase
VASSEGRRTRPGGAVFQGRSQVLSADDVARALRRMSHEIVERNAGLEGVVLVGLQRGGVPLAQAIAAHLGEIESTDVALGALDVAFYRDDVSTRPVLPESATSIPVALTGRTVVLVDDVLYTGRTIRAALHALSDFGRAARVQLAVLVDRGHRELPIRPDYVGKNLPTSKDESLRATLDGVELGTMVAS